MTHVDLTVLGLVLGASSSLAYVLLLALSRVEERRRQRDPSLVEAPRQAVVFLFEDEDLVDATPAARQLLSVAPHSGSDWARLVQVLLPQFPGISTQMSELVDAGAMSVAAQDGRSRIEAEWRQGLARLTLIDVERQETHVPVDKLALAALEDELDTLRQVTDHVPVLMWRETADGGIVWANAAYLAASRRFTEGQLVQSWPPHPVFAALGHASNAPQRAAVSFPGDRHVSWFEIRSFAVDSGWLCTASGADAVVAAEQSRREFVQTLTKTFAHLTVGLAIFDRSRKLALFNPALTDLTGLPTEFLAARPSLVAFSDRLRDARVLPEPKNYESWRQRLVAMEAAAENGSYAETWTQPDGQVFQVTGRPHPDGAIALLIEDVSAEMLLTRRLKAELHLTHEAIDSLEGAVAVFAEDGTMAFANRAYCRMWSIDLTQALRTRTWTSALSDWSRRLDAGAAWGGVVGPFAGGGLREPTQFLASGPDGERVDCRFTPLPGGAMVAAFHGAPAASGIFRHRPRWTAQSA